MSYQDELRAKIAEHDALVEKRNALVGQEGEEVRGQVEELDGQLDVAGQEVRKLQARAEEERAVEEARAALPKYTPRVRTEERGRTDADELRAVLNGEKRTHEFHIEKRALNAGTSSSYTDGTFAAAVLGAVEDLTSVLQAGAQVLNTGTGNVIDAPTMDSFAPAKVNEGSATSASGTSTPRRLTAYDYSGLVVLSNNLISDVNADVVGIVSDVASQEVSNVLNTALLLGDGSGDPQGAVVGATVGRAAAAAAITLEDIYALFYSVKSKNTSWIMSGETAAAVRTAAAASGQDSIFQVNPGTDNPDLLLGRPLITDPEMADVGASAKSVLFGDFGRGYLVRQVGGVEVSVSNDRYFEFRQTGVLVTVRADGLVTNPALIKCIQHAAS